MRKATCLLLACCGALWASSSEAAAHLRGAAFADSFDVTNCDPVATLDPITLANRRQSIHLVFSNFCIGTRKRVGFRVTVPSPDGLDCNPALGSVFHLAPNEFNGISCRIKPKAGEGKYKYYVESCVVATGTTCTPANAQPLEIEIPMGPLEEPRKP